MKHSFCWKDLSLVITMGIVSFCPISTKCVCQVTKEVTNWWRYVSSHEVRQIHSQLITMTTKEETNRHSVGVFLSHHKSQPFGQFIGESCDFRLILFPLHFAQFFSVELRVDRIVEQATFLRSDLQMKRIDSRIVELRIDLNHSMINPASEWVIDSLSSLLRDTCSPEEVGWSISKHDETLSSHPEWTLPSNLRRQLSPPEEDRRRKHPIFERDIDLNSRQRRYSRCSRGWGWGWDSLMEDCGDSLFGYSEDVDLVWFWMTTTDIQSRPIRNRVHSEQKHREKLEFRWTVVLSRSDVIQKKISKLQRKRRDERPIHFSLTLKKNSFDCKYWFDEISGKKLFLQMTGSHCLDCSLTLFWWVKTEEYSRKSGIVHEKDRRTGIVLMTNSFVIKWYRHIRRTTSLHERWHSHHRDSLQHGWRFDFLHFFWLRPPFSIQEITSITVRVIEIPNQIKISVKNSLFPANWIDLITSNMSEQCNWCLNSNSELSWPMTLVLFNEMSIFDLLVTVHWSLVDKRTIQLWVQSVLKHFTEHPWDWVPASCTLLISPTARCFLKTFNGISLMRTMPVTFQLSFSSMNRTIGH